MLFDFERFEDIAKSVYPETPYSFAESMSVFRYFFGAYEQAMGHPHPPIRTSQIVRICQDMPYLTQEYKGGSYADIDAEAYPAVIDAYFGSDFKNCDYRINHFFSGRIREMRFTRFVIDVRETVTG